MKICFEIEFKEKCEMSTAKAQVTIIIADATAPLVIDSSQVPTTGTVGQAFTGQFGVSGGTPPDGPMSVDQGALPDGLTLDASGLLSGTPTVAGTFNFEVTIDDAGPVLTGSARAAQQIKIH